MTCELTEVALGHRLVLMYDLIDLNSRNKVDIPVSIESKMDQLESALLFWKNNFSEISTPSAKFLAYTLDNMYDEENLSQTVLKGDDIQRVNALAELCAQYGFSLSLAKLELRVRHESHEGMAEEFLELQHVVKLDGNIMSDVIPWSASQIVQPNLSKIFDPESVSDFVSNGRALNQVHHKFVSHNHARSHTAFS